MSERCQRCGSHYGCSCVSRISNDVCTHQPKTPPTPTDAQRAAAERIYLASDRGIDALAAALASLGLEPRDDVLDEAAKAVESFKFQSGRPAYTDGELRVLGYAAERIRALRKEG